MTSPINLPIALPARWAVESSTFGVVLCARRTDGETQGYVTICERVRGFTLGISPVRVNTEDAQYAGRGWREHLYGDAVLALQEAVQPVEVAA